MQSDHLSKKPQFTSSMSSAFKNVNAVASSTGNFNIGED